MAKFSQSWSCAADRCQSPLLQVISNINKPFNIVGMTPENKIMNSRSVQCSGTRITVPIGTLLLLLLLHVSKRQGASCRQAAVGTYGCPQCSSCKSEIWFDGRNNFLEADTLLPASRQSESGRFLHGRQLLTSTAACRSGRQCTPRRRHASSPGQTT